MKLAQPGFRRQLVAVELFGDVPGHPFGDLLELEARKRGAGASWLFDNLAIISGKMDGDSLGEALHEQWARLLSHQFLMQSFHQPVQPCIREIRLHPMWTKQG